MQLDELLLKTDNNSAQIYMRRVELESQKNNILSQIQLCEAEMLRLDGEKRILNTLKAEQNKENKDGSQ